VSQLEQEVEKLLSLVNGESADCSPEVTALQLENTKLKHRLCILKKVNKVGKRHEIHQKLHKLTLLF